VTDNTGPLGSRKSESRNVGPYIAYDGTVIQPDDPQGGPWTVVVRLWNATATVWQGIAVCGQIAADRDHAISLVQKNGPWPEGAKFRAYPPGHPMQSVVWGDA
jgi:hypothetical protein